MTVTDSQTIVSGEVNETGRKALIEWLGAILKTGPLNADTWADELISNLDGGWAEQQGLSLEVRSFHTKSGNPEIYNFGPREYDLITTDDEGNELSRRVA